MTDESPVLLRLVGAYPADPVQDLVPQEHYAIVVQATGNRAGDIRLRLSNREDILRYAGHVGYRIEEPYRGHRYAAHACLALRPIAQRHGFAEVWITCDPDNWPSRRTCERIGAELVEIVDLPEDPDRYLDGERQKCRYRWMIA
jgi:tagatose 1,6-diphosphate aldolase